VPKVFAIGKVQRNQRGCAEDTRREIDYVFDDQGGLLTGTRACPESPQKFRTTRKVGLDRMTRSGRVAMTDWPVRPLCRWPGAERRGLLSEGVVVPGDEAGGGGCACQAEDGASIG